MIKKCKSYDISCQYKLFNYTMQSLKRFNILPIKVVKLKYKKGLNNGK